MKFTLLIAAMVFSTLSFGAATCPANSRTIRTCISTPKSGDGEIASAMSSVALCEDGGTTSIVLDKDGDTESSVVTVTQRMGGTSYSVVDGDMGISISLPTGMRPAPTTQARLTISFLKAKVSNSSTFTCK
jgi:hypothetical protein